MLAPSFTKFSHDDGDTNAGWTGRKRCNALSTPPGSSRLIVLAEDPQS